MTSIGIHHESRSSADTLRVATKVLLACGVLSSMLYVAADIGGGLRYPGYSFTSQNISELVAIGAPTKEVVEHLLVVYDILALLFSVGVLWDARRRTRALRITGMLLLAYLVIACIGFAMSPMHQRGDSALAGDFAHVLVAGGVVLLQFAMIVTGSFALGSRFRIYSLTTVAVMILASVPTFAYAPRVAANLPTPGMGLLERFIVYAPLLWLAVLALALMRDPVAGNSAPDAARRLKR
jgi:hypothetical membrane protein